MLNDLFVFSATNWRTPVIVDLSASGGAMSGGGGTTTTDVGSRPAAALVTLIQLCETYVKVVKNN
jgi:hypothetical protein